MTNDEIKEAFFNRKPVTCNDCAYKYVSGLIYRLDKNGEIYIQAELMDKSDRSVTISRPHWVHLAEKKGDKL